jgi:hypothetical protein
MNQSLFEKMLRTFQGTVLVIFAALLLLKVYSTLDWRMEHDTPILHYEGFLMDRYDMIPYRDFFDVNMPGASGFHCLIGKLFGYGDLPFRCVDLTLLSALLFATYKFMKRFGRLIAIWAVILFGLNYLSMGQTMSLQRDYVGIIPVAFALLCIPSETDKPVKLSRFILMGLLFGISVNIKPHLGIAFPIVFGTLLVFRWHSQRKSRLDFLKCAAVSGISLLVPVSLALVWLAANSALVPFINIMHNYVPLYSSITGDLVSVSKHARIIDIATKTIQVGRYSTFLLCSLFAYYYVVQNADGDRATTISLTCLCLCTLAYAVYPAFAGKFFSYHYMPFLYFCSMSIGLCLFKWPLQKSSLVFRTKASLLLMLFIYTVTVQLSLPQFVDVLVSDLRSGPEAHAPKYGRVDEIAGWLKGRLRPGDTVQPLDYTGGSLHAMLLAETKLATQFPGDYPFYHNVSLPFIQGLRQSFISQLRKASPRFIIKVKTMKPWFSGIDTTRKFPALHQFLHDYYTVVHKGDGYFIYERKNDARLPDSQ